MSADARSTAWMQWLYVAIAIVAFVGTNAQVMAYLGYGPVQGTINFWKETTPTPAATFLLVDIFAFGAAVLIWMFAECRRLGIAQGWAWLYFLGSAFVGISVFVPLFLAHRHRRIRRLEPSQDAALGGADFLAAAIVIASLGFVAFYSVTHLPHS